VSEENHEAVERWLAEAWGRRDIDAALAYTDPQIELDWSESRAPFSGIYRGHDGLRRFWASLWEAWDEFRVIVEEEIVECGEGRHITATAARARGRGSGIEVESRGAVLWTVRDGKIAGAKLFQSKDEALEAVGLSAEQASRPRAG
jgi:ketosteroid isomerase-like protein